MPVDRTDRRRRYAHQAFDVTTFGMPLEGGPSGYGKRLAGTTQSAILMTADAGSTAIQPIGDLTRGLWSLQIVNHVALSAGSVALVNLPAYGGEAAQALVTAIDLTATGVVALDNPILAPLPIDRPLEITVAGGTAGETATLSLLVTPAINAWF